MNSKNLNEEKTEALKMSGKKFSKSHHYQKSEDLTQFINVNQNKYNFTSNKKTQTNFEKSYEAKTVTKEIQMDLHELSTYENLKKPIKTSTFYSEKLIQKINLSIKTDDFKQDELESVIPGMVCMGNQTEESIKEIIEEEKCIIKYAEEPKVEDFEDTVKMIEEPRVVEAKDSNLEQENNKLLNQNVALKNRIDNLQTQNNKLSDNLNRQMMDKDSGKKFEEFTNIEFENQKLLEQINAFKF